MLDVFQRVLCEANKVKEIKSKEAIMQQGSKLQKSFTLIELLVVVLIIGILATLIIVSVMSNLAKSRDAKRKADLKTIADALDMYYQKYGTYKVTYTDPSGSITTCGNSEGEGIINCIGCGGAYGRSIDECLVNSGVIANVPADPLHNNLGSTPQAYMMAFVKSGTAPQPTKGVCLYARLESVPAGQFAPEWGPLTSSTNQYPCPTYSGSGMNYVIRRLAPSE